LNFRIVVPGLGHFCLKLPLPDNRGGKLGQIQSKRDRSFTKAHEYRPGDQQEQGHKEQKKGGQDCRQESGSIVGSNIFGEVGSPNESINTVMLNLQRGHRSRVESGEKREDSE
jgi:hypothetical protein